MELVKADLPRGLTLGVLQIELGLRQHFNASGSDLDATILLVHSVVAIIVHSEAKRQHFVIVAKLSHIERFWLPPRAHFVMSNCSLVHSHHILRVVLPCPLNEQVRGIIAQTHELLGL